MNIKNDHVEATIRRTEEIVNKIWHVIYKACKEIDEMPTDKNERGYDYGK